MNLNQEIQEALEKAERLGYAIVGIEKARQLAKQQQKNKDKEVAKPQQKKLIKKNKSIDALIVELKAAMDEE